MDSVDQFLKQHTSVAASLEKILELAMSADNASAGNIQIYNTKLNGLEIAVHRGFPESFLQFFRVVRPDEPCICGRALRHRARVVVPDVTLDPYYAPYLSLAQVAGFRGVQSTPVFGTDNRVVGMISTHFADTHRLSTSAAALLDEYAARVASVLGNETQHSVHV